MDTDYSKTIGGIIIGFILNDPPKMVHRSTKEQVKVAVQKYSDGGVFIHDGRS